jgi:hypothetical protein
MEDRKMSNGRVHNTLRNVARATRFGVLVDSESLIAATIAIPEPSELRSAKQFVRTTNKILKHTSASDQTLQLMNQVISIAQQFELHRAFFRATLRMAAILKQRKDYSRSLQFLDRAIQIATENKLLKALRKLEGIRAVHHALLVHQLHGSTPDPFFLDEPQSDDISDFRKTKLEIAHAYGGKFDKPRYSRRLARECQIETTYTGGRFLANRKKAHTSSLLKRD